MIRRIKHNNRYFPCYSLPSHWLLTGKTLLTSKRIACDIARNLIGRVLKNKHILLSGLLLAILALVFCSSIGYGEANPVVITEYKTVTRVVPHFIELPAKIEYRYFRVPVKVEVPVKLEPFESEQELAELLAAYGGNKVLLLRNKLLVEDNDCDDFALALVEFARSQGKDIVWDCIHKGTIWNSKRLKMSHMGCATIIGNDVYFINPVTKEYWIAYRRD